MKDVFLELTSRERDVARLLLRGLSNKEMGRALNISSRTIEVHRQRIFLKLDVRNAVQLARIVSENSDETSAISGEQTEDLVKMLEQAPSTSEPSVTDRVLGAALLKIERIQTQLDEIAERFRLMTTTSKE